MVLNRAMGWSLLHHKRSFLTRPVWMVENVSRETNQEAFVVIWVLNPYPAWTGIGGEGKLSMEKSRHNRDVFRRKNWWTILMDWRYGMRKKEELMMTAIFSFFNLRIMWFINWGRWEGTDSYHEENWNWDGKDSIQFIINQAHFWDW